MAASVFLHHVVGDLTLGKPELVEFHESETVEAAIRAIGECSEGVVAVWRKRAAVHQHLGHQQQLPPPPAQSAEEPRVARFIGLLSSMDVAAFLARTGDHERALRTPVSEVVTPDSSLLKEVDPGTRLIDALEMMKQGVRRLLVRKSVAWRGMSKRFSILDNGNWLKNQDPSSVTGSGGSSHPSFASRENTKFCCLSREDVVRFLIGRLGALAPLPLSPISALGAISPHYAHISASSPALECTRMIPQDPCVVAVVETNPDGAHKIIGEISAYRLQKCDYLAAAWGIAHWSAGQFILGFEDNTATLGSRPGFAPASPHEDGGGGGGGVAPRSKRFSSRSIGFFSGQVNPLAAGGLRSMYRGRSTPLMCKNTSSLAAVMAQMLSHRATHVWVTDANSDDALVGIVGYTDVLNAVTWNHPSATASSSP